MKNTQIFFVFFIVFLIMTESCGQEKDAETIKALPQPEIGDVAPDFTLKNQDQLNISLSDFRGEKNVILVFYPLDFTPVWIGELSEYRDNYKRLRELNAEVLGISVDSFASHKKFRSELKLPFDLLSDWDRKVTQTYGVYNFKEGVANRVSFLIDKKIGKWFWNNLSADGP